jgi:ketosteroid isomerase-like protein
MKRVVVMAAVIIACSSFAAGQASVKKSATVSRSEQAVRNLERLYAEAVTRQDVATLDRILADDFIATSSRGEVRNKSHEIDDIKPNPDYALEAFKLDDLNVRIFGEMAIITGRSTLKAGYKGQSSPSLFRYTRVYAKRKGRWQVVSQQLTRLPTP